MVVELISEFYTNTYKNPANSVVKSSLIGAWANINKGLEKGLLSTVFITITIAASVYGAYYFAGFYGIAISSVALLANSGIQLAFNTFYPIVENADSIASQKVFEPSVKQNTEILKDIGNNQLPISKSFSILSGFLTTLTILIVFINITGFSLQEYNSSYILISLFAGIMLPFMFTSVIIGANDRIKSKMLKESNNQISDIFQLKDALDIVKKYDGDLSFANEEEIAIVNDAETKVEHSRFVELSTYYSVLEAVIVGVSAIVITVIVGYLFGASILASMLIGSFLSSTLIAFFQSNTASVWSSTEKMISDGVQWDSMVYEKGSEAHKASVVGLLVGNIFKNTSAPTLNIVIKVMALTALIIASGI